MSYLVATLLLYMVGISIVLYIYIVYEVASLKHSIITLFTG